MALSEFLKQIDLEEMFKSKERGENAMEITAQAEPSKQALRASEASHSQETAPPSVELVSHSSTTAPHSLPSSTQIQVPPDRHINKRPREEISDDESIASTRRLNRRASQLQSRHRLHSVIEELWNLVPEEKRAEGNQLSRTEKIEMAIEHLRGLQDRLNAR